MNSIEEQVIETIATELNIDRSKVVGPASFIEDLGADSLDTVELVMELEERFGIEIPDDVSQKILTVQDAIDYIVAHTNDASNES